MGYSLRTKRKNPVKTKSLPGMMLLLLLILAQVGLCGCTAGPDATSELSCTISINCSNALARDTFNADLRALLPEDGWILPETEVALQEGDSVFDVLLHTVRTYQIHMEYADTPIYDSAYIEGIANLYEFDAGAESGWMYQVNGVFPNYGCSAYTVADGDVIRWVYTCDLGKDVGNSYAE